MRLAQALRPRDVTRETWYRDAMKAKETIQNRRKQQEEAAKDKADKPFRDMIASDLTKIKEETKKGCKDFLKFINEQYVPATKKLTLDDTALKESNLKRLMTTKFSLIFHPDKNVNEQR